MDSSIAAGTRTAMPVLYFTMPGCRRSVPSASVPIPGHGIRLTRYVVQGRQLPRACNDNRRSGSPEIWHWALAIGVAPIVSLALILAIIF